MIKSIKSLTNFGIFKEFNDANIEEFREKNLIYGWNGSGKTTLGKLFRTLELKEPPSDEWLDSADFRVSVTEDDDLVRGNVSSCNLNIFTFNQDFIVEHIDWNNKVEGILLVGEGKKDTDILNALAESIAEKRTEWNSALKAGQELNKNIKEFRSSAAKRIKTVFQAFETSDQYYLHYDAPKFEKFIGAQKEALINGSAILGDDELSHLTKSVKPSAKSSIEFELDLIDEKTLEKASARLQSLLSEGIAATGIEKLKENSDLQSWVAQGLEMHQATDAENCEFCGNKISTQRWQELEAHFSDVFEQQTEKLKRAAEWTREQFYRLVELPHASMVYEELHGVYSTTTSDVSKALEIIDECFTNWMQALERKIANPFETDIAITHVNSADIETANIAIEEFNKVLEQHNDKSANFEAELKKSKKALELHFAAQELSDRNYYDDLEKAKLLEEKSLADNKTFEELVDKHTSLRNSMSDETLGAEKFNEALHKFMGRQDISLQFNSDKLGYEIIRYGDSKHTGHLSEGEKTAIAFVYFVIKLGENSNSIEQSIIVIDDPVSSFDSNNIFYAFSFLKAQCEKAKQLFILTHNLTFFKLVRDWFQNKNKNRKGAGKPAVSNFYIVKVDSKTERTAEIANAPNALLSYNSEYHFLFEKLYGFKGKDTLEISDALLVANIGRKLLEAFLSFKYPDCRGNIRQLMDTAQKKSKSITVEIQDKIYWFVNKYSHSDIIEIDDDKADSLFCEGNNIVPYIFKWIEELDSDHYQAMINSLDLSE